MKNASLLSRAALLAVAAVVVAAAPSFADVPGGKATGTGDGNGGIGAGVHVSYSTTGNSGGTSTHPLGSANVTWTPPPCWIAPIAGPQEFKKMLLNSVKETDAYPGQANYAMQAMEELRRHYAENYTWDGGGKGYKDFNVDQEGKGAFWGPVENPDSDSPERFNCNSTLPFWVPNGQRPPAGTPNVITTEMLSKLAFAHTTVPGVTIVTSPAATQTVNFDTWVSLKEAYTPVTVRASLNIPGAASIWAETTATPTSVRISPGTQFATVHPGNGECAIGAGGQVGTPYTKGATGAPPCGVTYLHSTQNSPGYQLNVTATWAVTWRGSDGATTPALPDGVIKDGRTITVQEIEAVNR